MTDCSSDPDTILIDDQSAMVAGTFAIICSLLGAVANAVTMFVILADKKIKHHCTTPGQFSFLFSFQIFTVI